MEFENAQSKAQILCNLKDYVIKEAKREVYETETHRHQSIALAQTHSCHSHCLIVSVLLVARMVSSVEYSGIYGDVLQHHTHLP